MNRPIFIILIGYIIGIIWGLYFKMSIVFFYAMLLISYIIINKSYKKKKLKIFSIKRYFKYFKLIFKVDIIIVIIISSFISNCIIKYQDNKYNTFYGGEKLEVQAIIIGNCVHKEYYNRYKIKVCEGKFKNIPMYLNTSEELNFGDKVEIKGEFIEPQIRRNYKGFDYKEYLKTQKIYGTIKAEKVNKIGIFSASSILQISNKIFLKIKNNIEQTYSNRMASIIKGIMLGYTEDIDDETKNDFSNSNISHVLAVSGMHISYIIFLATSSSSKILGKRKSKIFASILLMAYMCITGFSISVVRACVMEILTCMAFVFYRKSDTLNNISIAMLITLIDNPYSIKSISFLLTYGGTIGIIYFKTPVEKFIKNIKIRNRKWKYVFLKLQRKCENLISIISVSISAQIVISPIMIMFFNKLSLGFLVTNLLLSYVIGSVVIIGFIQIIITMFSVNAGIAIAKIVEVPVYAIVLISKINLWNFRVVTPNWYEILLYYVIAFIIKYLYSIFNSKNLTITQERIKNSIYLVKYKIRPYFFKTIVVITIVSICFGIVKNNELAIHFIDVGQGDSTLIVTTMKKTILIDGGGSSTYDIGKNVLVPYLLARKIKRLDYVIVSHSDLDHISGILTVLQEIKVEKIIVGKQGEINENYKKLVNIANEKSIKIITVKCGDKINIEKNLCFNVLFPTEKLITDNILNNNSLVLKMCYKNFSVLFTGDIEEKAEAELLRLYSANELKSDIIKAPHHRF